MINQNEKWEEKENIIQKKISSKPKENVKCVIIGEARNDLKKKPENGIIERKKKGDSGIYIIKNKINGKFYLGRSKNINKRFTEHKRLLKRNKHHSLHLQHAWNKYGSENFELLILEETKPIIKIMVELEQKYINTLKPHKKENGYNISKGASGSNDKPNNLIINYNKLSKSKPIFQYNLKGDFIKEWKSITDASIFYRCHSSSIWAVCATKVKTCKNFVWRYKSEIKNENNKIPLKEIKNSCHKPILQYDLDGNFIKEWESGYSAKKQLKINQSQITSNCQGKRRTVGGFVWRYKLNDKIDFKIEIPERGRTYKPILQYDLEGNFIKEWKGIRFICESLNISKGIVRKSCMGKKIRKNYRFKYKLEKDIKTKNNE